MKIALSLVLALALAIGAWQLVSWRNLPPQIPVTKASIETIASTVSTNGKVDPVESAQARAEAAGRVSNILIKLRDHVEQGQALVELDTGQLRQELESAEARIAAVRAEMDVIDAGGRQAERIALQNQVNEATVELNSAKVEFDREMRLEAQGVATREQVQGRKTRVDQLQTQINGLKERLATLVTPSDRKPLEARLREAEAVKQQIVLRIDQSTVRAPISGTIFQFDLKAGAYLNPGDVVAAVGRLTQVHVVVYVDEPDLGRVRPGLPVTITWDAKPGREWSGTVDRLPAQVRSLETRQVGEVTCIIDNPDQDLLPGSNVTARIVSETVPNAVTIPKEALFRENGKTGVWLVVHGKNDGDADHLEWRDVTTATSNVTRTQVLGLKSDEILALPSDQTYAQNMLVRKIQP
jgi:HlyD family secretion protein